MVRRGFSDEAGREVLLGGASGAGSLLLNTKASQEAACSRAPAAIVPGQKPESRDTGVSGNVGKGSHLAATDTAEGHAGQVGGSGGSGNAENGSHLAVVRRNAPLPGQKPDAQTRQCSSTAGRTGALFDKSPMPPLPTWGTNCRVCGWQISV